MSLFIKKDINILIKDAAEGHGEGHVEGSAKGSSSGLKRHLGAFNLTMLGIGAIIGAGIFSLTGAAAAQFAGPGIVYSFVLGGVLCALAGLCYSEMAAMVPVAGSAYSYSYATLGELVAWIIGWDLVLEYAFGAVTVSVSWSGYLVSLLSKTLGMPITDSILRFTKGPWEMVTLADGSQAFGIWNFPATVIALVVAAILYRGIKESSLVNNIIVMIKVAIILAFIAVGWGVINHANWFVNPLANGFAQLIPPPEMMERHGHSFTTYGWPGVLTGAGVVFFAYIGFDALSTTAQEVKNPQRNLPIGILASLVICTIIYILMALVMTGVVPYKELNVADPVAVGVDHIVALRGWSPVAQHTLSFLVKVGALMGLTSVILVMMLGQTRVFYAMARDGLLPWFDRVHNKFSTPHIATMVTGVFVAICGGLMPLSLVGELVSIGTLLAFVLVCLAIPILRRTNPELPRPFRTPAHMIVAPLGALACLWVMWGLPVDTWIRLAVWLVIGFIVYFTYGIKHSKVRKNSKK
jgi:APA family basic amino acid/polyamine antiporter